MQKSYGADRLAEAIGRPAAVVEALHFLSLVSPATAYAVALADAIRMLRSRGVPRAQVMALLGTDVLTVRRVSRALGL